MRKIQVRVRQLGMGNRNEQMMKGNSTRLKNRNARSGGLRLLFFLGAFALVLICLTPLLSLAQETCQDCTASAMNPITAAWATLGYWAQADMIYQLTNTDLGLWAPLLYIMAAFSGLIMMALGQPPRLYIWFLIGPAIYNWLLLTPVERKGVAWAIANEAQDMTEVWKLATVGFNNINHAKRLGIRIENEQEPPAKAEVALLFAWYDDLISSQVQYLVGWSGMFSQEGGTDSTHQRPNGAEDKAWTILSNSKWPMLENITAAGLHNGNLRESFVHFFASECGDAVAEFIDKANFVSASHARGALLPSSVFQNDPNDPNGGSQNLYKRLNSTIIPAPWALVSLLKEAPGTADSNFTGFNNYLKSEVQPRAPELKNIGCDAYLWILLQGFRWEAGHAFNQIIAEAPGFDIDPREMIFAFIYGWKFGENSESLSPEEQQDFIIDLIFLHLFRNEIALAPSMQSVRYSSAERSVNYTEAYMRNIGSKSKYGELYTWAKMMPYLQGVLLYILSLAFPIVCVLIVIPGWHKTIFTWMGFFAWAKSWDAGFAIVMSFERTLWATIGNTTDQAMVNKRILELQDIARVQVMCQNNPQSGAAVFRGELGCPIPTVTEAAGELTRNDMMDFFDQALLLAAHLDLDLSNSYYIYLMSALYFAVPAVTGQVLLGAKSGFSGMVNTMVGGVAGETGKGAGSGFTGEVATKQNNAFSAGKQANRMKALRASGLAEQAIDIGNRGLQQDALGQHMQTARGLLENQSQVAGMRQSGIGSALQVMDSGAAVGFKGMEGWRRGRQASAAGVGAGGGAAAAGGAAGTIGDTLFGAGSAMPSVLSSLGRRRAELDTHATQLGNIKAGMGFSIGQFQAGASSRGYGLEGNRMQSAAEAMAAESGWQFARDYSSSVTGRNSALGVFAGNYSAGEKPMHADGMASVGQLGGSAKSSFWWAGQPYQDSVKSAAQGLGRKYGPQNVDRIYEPGNYNVTSASSFAVGGNSGAWFGKSKASSLYKGPSYQNAARSSAQDMGFAL